MKKKLAKPERKPRVVPKTMRIRRLKKTLLTVWSLIVRRRDDHTCLLCGSRELLTAHHWCLPKKTFRYGRYHPYNGATLCYACHIRRVHREDSTYSLSMQIKEAVAMKYKASAACFWAFVSKCMNLRWTGAPECVESEESLRAELLHLRAQLLEGANAVCADCAKAAGIPAARSKKDKHPATCGTCPVCGRTNRMLKSVPKARPAE